MEDTTKKNTPIFKKWWFWVLAVVVIGIIGSQASKNKNSSPEGTAEAKTETKATAKPALPTFSARTMFDDYEANEISADNKYKGKEFNITGTIHDVGKDIMGKAFVALETKNQFLSIQCYVKDANTLAKLSKGQSVTLSGTGGGKTITISVDDAEVVN